MQEAQQKKPSFIPPAPAPKDADQGFAPPRFPVQSHAKQPSVSGKATRAYSSYDRDLIQTKLLEGMDRAIPRQGQAEAIQPKDAHCEAEDGVQLKDDGESVQQKSPQDIAADGFRGTPRQLPHLDKIQQSFGQDLSHVQAYTGKEAAAASQKLRAAAYTSGNRIAFAKTPSVGLAAHEAAHVMQQQSGQSKQKESLVQLQTVPPGPLLGSGLAQTEISRQQVAAINAFRRNYMDMREANWIGGDLYFHCKANCEAAQVGSHGATMAAYLSNSREFIDRITGDPPEASNDDQEANRYGRRGGRNNTDGSCKDICETFRPEGLPDQY